MPRSGRSNVSIAVCLGVVLIFAGAAGGDFFGRLKTPGGNASPPEEPEAASSVAKIPAWVPIFPGARISAGNANRTYFLATGERWERVAGFYNRELQVSGYRVTRGKDGQSGSTLIAQNGKGRVVKIAPAEDLVVLTFSERR